MPRTTDAETVLIIDDEPLIVNLIKKDLAREYTIITAGTGAEAINIFRSSPELEVHLLLVDIAMPDLTGPEVVKRIHEIRPGVPALYVSGHLMNESPPGSTGVQYIAKPFTPRQLRIKVREMLGRAHNASPACPECERLLKEYRLLIHEHEDLITSRDDARARDETARVEELNQALAERAEISEWARVALRSHQQTHLEHPQET
jgi:DNA-binding response OmpR family regulator